MLQIPGFNCEKVGKHCRHLNLLLSFQCHFCDKAFMNQAFLQSHIQRRHTEEAHLGKHELCAQSYFPSVPFPFLDEV